MNRIPVYEVMDQRPVAGGDEDGGPPSTVFRPTVGDECTVRLTDVRLSADCSPSDWLSGRPEDGGGGGGGDGDGPQLVHRRLVLGEADCAVDRALEAVLRDMRPGEARDFCAGDGRGGRATGRVALSAVRKGAGSAGWRADDRLKLAEAARHKAAGNRLYAGARYADAMHRFNRAARHVLFVRDADDAARRALYAAVCNNMAACQLHLANYEHAARLCGKALSVDPDNTKALARRCRASAELGAYDAALADGRRVLHREPGNAVARRYMDVAARGLDAQNARYRDMVKKMFA